MSGLKNIHVNSFAHSSKAMDQAALSFRHVQALFQAIEYAYATGGDAKLDVMSLAELGLSIAGEAGEHASNWADMLGAQDLNPQCAEVSP